MRWFQMEIENRIFGHLPFSPVGTTPPNDPGKFGCCNGHFLTPSTFYSCFILLSTSVFHPVANAVQHTPTAAPRISAAAQLLPTPAAAAPSNTSDLVSHIFKTRLCRTFEYTALSTALPMLRHFPRIHAHPPVLHQPERHPYSRASPPP